MSSGKKHSLKAGDLVAMVEDRSQVALVLAPGWYGCNDEIETWTVLWLGPGYVSPIIRGVETMKVWWSDENEPTEIDTIAYEKGWVLLVSSVSVPMV